MSVVGRHLRVVILKAGVVEMTLMVLKTRATVESASQCRPRSENASRRLKGLASRRISECLAM